MRHLTCDSDTETIGAAMLSIIDNAQSEEIFPILQEHGLIEIKPDEWYPTQKWLSFMNELADHPNATPNYVAIGMKIAENVVLPPQLQSASLEQILFKWDDIYHMQHRGENIGYKEIEKLTDRSYRIVLRDLYPDDLSYGVAYGFCRRFLPPGTHFTVSYEDLDKRRDDGTHDETVLLIEWE